MFAAFKYLLFVSLFCLSQANAIENTSNRDIKIARAFIKATAGNKVKGVVTFEEVEDGVRVTANLQGLTPGKHGFHIHEHGDCSSMDGSSTGAHYDPVGGYLHPTAMPHGGPDSTMRHVGDLGNVDADQHGNAYYDRVDRLIKLNGPFTIVGRSIVVDAYEDNFVTQPTGASGPAIGCGVIKRLWPR